MIGKILVALDGSSRATNVLARATELAHQFGASLLVLRAITVPPEFPAAAAFATKADSLPAIMQREAIKELHALTARNPNAADAAFLVREGRQPWRTIIDTAEEVAADLIVIGSHGYEGLDHFLGTTAGHVVNHARCDVLVARVRAPALPDGQNES